MASAKGKSLCHYDPISQTAFFTAAKAHRNKEGKQITTGGISNNKKIFSIFSSVLKLLQPNFQIFLHNLNHMHFYQSGR
jgi:hypothetical protein